MPCSSAKARILLKKKKAVVVRRTPFTIQLTIATGETKQPVSLGVDAGYKHVGLSASTEKAELYASEVELRQDITERVGWHRLLRIASMHIFHALLPFFEYCLLRRSLWKQLPSIRSF